MKTEANEQMMAALDDVMREITRLVAGVELTAAARPYPREQDVQSVLLTSRGTVEAELELFLGKNAMRAMTRFMNRGEALNETDMIDYIEEYFNILCGHIAGRFRSQLHKNIRFGIPAFSRQPHTGACEGEGLSVYDLRYESAFGPIRLRAVLHEEPCRQPERK